MADTANSKYNFKIGTIGHAPPEEKTRSRHEYDKFLLTFPLPNDGMEHSKEEAVAVSEVLTLFTEAHPDQRMKPRFNTVLKCVRARKMRVDKALLMLTKLQEWREEIGLAAAYDNPTTPNAANTDTNKHPPPNADTNTTTDGSVPACCLQTPDPKELLFQTICPHAYHGLSKDGLPIYWERTGDVNLTVFTRNITRQECAMRHVRSQMVQAHRMAIASPGPDGFPVTKQICIMDLAHISLSPSSAGLQNFKDLVHIDSNFFPETLQHIFMINSPWLFSPLWAVVRPWIDPVTVKKFHILSSNYKEELLKYIDADQIPVEYGGTSAWEMPKLLEHDL
eukprot:m.172525 g.172525  ORF g.172525 m.172525 type:complete len:336 (+) comp31689_c2_seq3:296-1303(+)